MAGESAVSKAVEIERRVLEQKGRVVDKRNHKGLRGFSLAPLRIDLPK